MFFKKKKPKKKSVPQEDEFEVFTVSVGKEYPLSDDRPPNDSASVRVLSSGPHLLIQFEPPFEADIAALNSKNTIRSLYIDPQSGWPIVAFYFETGALYSAPVFTTQDHSLSWFAEKGNAFHLMLIDRRNNIVVESRILGTEPDFKLALGEALANTREQPSAELAARLGTLPTSEVLFGHRVWLWSDESEGFSEVKDPEHLAALKAHNA
jgi:hypothetical protein